jgi:hypothetical protein
MKLKLHQNLTPLSFAIEYSRFRSCDTNSLYSARELKAD